MAENIITTNSELVKIIDHHIGVQITGIENNGSESRKFSTVKTAGTIGINFPSSIELSGLMKSYRNTDFQVDFSFKFSTFEFKISKLLAISEDDDYLSLFDKSICTIEVQVTKKTS